MTSIMLKGNPIKLAGALPTQGERAPNFILTKTDLTEISMQDLVGKKVILNIFPSLDTSVCATSVRKFNEYANKLTNVKILCVSADLPFAHKRFCEVEGLKNVILASVFRHKEFGNNYGLTILEGPMTSLLARAIVIFDEYGKVIYTQQVSELSQEPDYEKALAAI